MYAEPKQWKSQTKQGPKTKDRFAPLRYQTPPNALKPAYEKVRTSRKAVDPENPVESWSTSPCRQSSAHTQLVNRNPSYNPTATCSRPAPAASWRSTLCCCRSDYSQAAALRSQTPLTLLWNRTHSAIPAFWGHSRGHLTTNSQQGCNTQCTQTRPTHSPSAET
jgi:hypothetical protein